MATNLHVPEAKRKRRGSAAASERSILDNPGRESDTGSLTPMETIPTFALLNVRLDGWYQNQIWHGVSTAARLLGVRLVALVGSAFRDPERRGGSESVYALAGSPRIDGYLPAVGALANFSGKDTVLEFLESLPPRPTVCVGMELGAYPAVYPDGEGIGRIVGHLVEAHGLTRLAYMGGPRANPDAVHRLTDFVNTAAKEGVAVPPGWIMEGDFSPELAKRLFDAFLEREGAPPRALVCANDAMALGVRKSCRERGVRIPEDMVLTGFDDIDEAATMSPSLTSVDAVAYQVGFRAVELLHELCLGREVRSEAIPTALVLLRSCGCRSGGATSLHLPRLLAEATGVPGLDKLRATLFDPVQSGLFLERLEAVLEDADHAELDLWEERIFAVATSAPPPHASAALLRAQSAVSHARRGVDLNQRQALQILLRDQYWALQQMVSLKPGEDLPHRILDAFRILAGHRLRVLLFRADGAPVQDPRFDLGGFEIEVDVANRTVASAPRDALLPSGGLPVASWIAMPLSLGAEHFGVVQVRDWNSNEVFLESLRYSLSMALSMAHRSRQEHDAREELRKLSHRDELTGVLNRRGLLEQGEFLVRSAMRSGTRIGVVLCDLDGLKEINDAHGHADGDKAIQCLARALEDGFRQSDVVGRLGGDEFAVVTLLAAEGGLEGAIERVRRALAKRAAELGRPWTARTSAGWMAWVPGDGETLEQAIIRADQSLYHDKRQRKGREGF